MDDDYQTYLNRLARMTLPEAYQAQVQNIQESYKYQLTATGKREAVPFPGYTIITPPSQEDVTNNRFYNQLQDYQTQLLNLSVNSELIVPVPTTSFHLTLADLIWDSAYRDACNRNPDYELDLQSCCSKIFEQYRQTLTGQTNSIRLSILGIMLMPRAIGVCLVPQDRSCYEQIVNFRRNIYQNSQLIALGIEQNYHLTAHITLGYFGQITPDLQREKFAQMLAELNQQWLGNTPEFVVPRGELRKFDDMTGYYRQPEWATIEF